MKMIVRTILNDSNNNGALEQMSVNKIIRRFCKSFKF